MKFSRSLSPAYRMAFFISVFFLVNSFITAYIDVFSPYASYICGFGIGVLAAVTGSAVHRRHRNVDATDVQVEIAVDLCKQMASLSADISKGLPSEIYHLVYASKAYFQEAGEVLEVGFNPSRKPYVAQMPSKPVTENAAPPVAGNKVVRQKDSVKKSGVAADDFLTGPADPTAMRSSNQRGRHPALI